MPRLQENAHRGVSPKFDDSNSQFSSQIFIVAFGGDVRRTEGVKMDSQPIRPQFHPQDFLGGSHLAAQFFCAL